MIRQLYHKYPSQMVHRYQNLKSDFYRPPFHMSGIQKRIPRSFSAIKYKNSHIPTQTKIIKQSKIQPSLMDSQYSRRFSIQMGITPSINQLQTELKQVYSNGKLYAEVEQQFYPQNSQQLIGQYISNYSTSDIHKAGRIKRSPDITVLLQDIKKEIQIQRPEIKAYVEKYRDKSDIMKETKPEDISRNILKKSKQKLEDQKEIIEKTVWKMNEKINEKEMAKTQEKQLMSQENDEQSSIHLLFKRASEKTKQFLDKFNQQTTTTLTKEEPFSQTIKTPHQFDLSQSQFTDIKESIHTQLFRKPETKEVKVGTEDQPILKSTDLKLKDLSSDIKTQDKQTIIQQNLQELQDMKVLMTEINQKSVDSKNYQSQLHHKRELRLDIQKSLQSLQQDIESEIKSHINTEGKQELESPTFDRQLQEFLQRSAFKKKVISLIKNETSVEEQCDPVDIDLSQESTYRQVFSPGKNIDGSPKSKKTEVFIKEIQKISNPPSLKRSKSPKRSRSYRHNLNKSPFVKDFESLNEKLIEKSHSTRKTKAGKRSNNYHKKLENLKEVISTKFQSRQSKFDLNLTSIHDEPSLDYTKTQSPIYETGLHSSIKNIEQKSSFCQLRKDIENADVELIMHRNSNQQYYEKDQQISGLTSFINDNHERSRQKISFQEIVQRQRRENQGLREQLKEKKSYRLQQLVPERDQSQEISPQRVATPEKQTLLQAVDSQISIFQKRKQLDRFSTLIMKKKPKRKNPNQSISFQEIKKNVIVRKEKQRKSKQTKKENFQDFMKSLEFDRPNRFSRNQF